MTRDGGPIEPKLPPGRDIVLPGRGTTFIRELGEVSDPNAPTVLLLHGWTASADLNWFRSYFALGERHRVVAVDHHGHGGGVRSRKLFRLSDCADDAAAVADVLGIDRYVPVGYSMGGPIAQLMWKRHRDRVAGLVLCATASSFSGSREERLSFMGLGGLAAIARLAPAQARRWLTAQLYLQRKHGSWEPWAIEQVGRHEWRTVLEAGRAIGTFSSAQWISSVDVPVSVILTMRDHVVPLKRQMRMLESLPDARAFRVDGDHDACIARGTTFVPTLLRAVDSVVERLSVRP